MFLTEPQSKRFQKKVEKIGILHKYKMMWWLFLRLAYLVEMPENPLKTRDFVKKLLLILCKFVIIL